MVAHVLPPLRQDDAVYYRHLLDWQVVAIVVAIKLSVFVLFGFYNRWWRYVSTRDMWGAARGVTVASALDVPRRSTRSRPQHTSRLPRGIVALDYLLLLAFVAGTRLLARTLIERPPAGLVARGKEVLVVGAGDAGQLIVREMQRNRQLALHADRPRRRRPAQEERPHPRRPRARHDRRPRRTSCATTGRTRC